MSSQKPWLAETIVDEKLARQLVENQFPELHPLTIQFLGKGWDNIVYSVNQNFIFRFPQRESAVELLNHESILLPKLKGFFSIPIPEPIFQGKPSDQFKYPFLGYTYLAGRTACSVNLKHSNRSHLIKPLAEFLFKLHSISEKEAFNLGGSKDLSSERFDVDFLKTKILSHLNTIESLGIYSKNESFFEILNDIQKPCNNTELTLIHGDLYSRHLLLDKQNELCGIIDWGDACVSHPAIDLQVVFTFFHPSLHADFFNLYHHVSDETKKLAKLRALYSATGTAIYSHDVKDQNLLQESKTALFFLSERI